MGVEGLQCIKDFDGQVQCHVQHRRETNDTTAISHLLTNSSFNTVFAFHCRKVVRKYVEQDRSVFSCVIKTQPTLDTSQFCTDTCTLQVVVRPIEENVSLIDSFYNVKSRFLSQRNAVLSGDFDTFVLAVYSEMFQRFTELVESYLLDSS
ncbi:hypothetical protein PHMEG_00041185 [Phytophthora megakarya]|uniref:Uncharacterized protein n=1 Tax=Phytophthora megakarya TaxID=4795 RepID=A0A225UCF4_9STRA|nr:hypothetical protein PHMEG_00041185 [Phytophthora megakarya]